MNSPHRKFIGKGVEYIVIRRKVVIIAFISLLFIFLTTSDVDSFEVPQAPAYPEGEVIVKFSPSIAQSADFAEHLRALNLKMGTEIIGEIPALNAYLLKTVKGKGVESLVNKILKENGVEYAEPNYYRYALEVPNDPKYRYQWNYRIVQAPLGWDIQKGDPSIIVAVLDTGVDLSHPDLVGNLTSGYDFAYGDSVPDDVSGHGTHVSGTIAAMTNNGMGVAGLTWRCLIMPVKVLANEGWGTEFDLSAGIVYAAQKGAKIINMSLGSYYSGELEVEAIDYAHNGGLVIVAATGNDDISQIVYPAAYPNTIAVGATDLHDERAFYSNYGATLDVMAPGGDMRVDGDGDGYPDGILSTLLGGTYGYYQGTSMATPHVSALAALIMSKGVTDNGEVRNIIESSVDDLGTPGWDIYTGFGRINVYRALKDKILTVVAYTSPVYRNDIKLIVKSPVDLVKVFYQILYRGSVISSGIAQRASSEEIGGASSTDYKYWVVGDRLPSPGMYAITVTGYREDGREIEGSITYTLSEDR